MRTSTEQAKDHPPIPPRQRKRLSVVALLIIIVALLSSSVLFWLWRGNSSGSANMMKTDATVTTTDIPTWMPTPVTPPAGSLFYDTFVNNNHGWDLSNDYASGTYRILAPLNNTLILVTNTALVESVPTSINLSDYIVSAVFTINQISANDSVGLYVRGDSNLDHDYRIDINGNNTFDVAKEWLDTSSSTVQGKTTLLVPPRSSNLLQPPGKQNTLTVILLGPTLVVELNNIVVAQISDSSYTSGQTALFAHDGGGNNGVTVSFTKVEVDRVVLPQQTPVPTLTPTPVATVRP